MSEQISGLLIVKPPTEADITKQRAQGKRVLAFMAFTILFIILMIYFIYHELLIKIAGVLGVPLRGMVPITRLTAPASWPTMHWWPDANGRLE